MKKESPEVSVNTPQYMINPPSSAESRISAFLAVKTTPCRESDQNTAASAVSGRGSLWRWKTD